MISSSSYGSHYPSLDAYGLSRGLTKSLSAPYTRLVTTYPCARTGPGTLRWEKFPTISTFLTKERDQKNGKRQAWEPRIRYDHHLDLSPSVRPSMSPYRLKFRTKQDIKDWINSITRSHYRKDGIFPDARFLKGDNILATSRSVNYIPDDNNNFLCQKMGMRRTKPTKGTKEKGYNRTEILCRPKSLPMSCCGDRRSVQQKSHRHSNKIDSRNSSRLEALAQPVKRPAGLGCKRSPPYSSSPRYSRDPAEIDWDRLAAPKRPWTKCLQTAPGVSKAALQAKATRRLERLATPRLKIDGGDYYTWLLNKQPDTEVKLKKFCKLDITKCDLNDMRVMLRCDLDLSGGGSRLDAKIDMVLPTIRHALDKGAKALIIISPCGEPRGQRVPELSLRPAAQKLQSLLEREVIFMDDCVGPEAAALCEDPEPGSVFLLENLRFHPEEDGCGLDMEGNEFECTREDVNLFRTKLFNNADVYIADAFTGLVQMSNTMAGEKKQDRGYGFNIKHELDMYNQFVVNPTRPMVAVVGGLFHSTIKVVINLLGKASEILLGGEIAMVFFKVLKRLDVGDLVVTPTMARQVLHAMSRARDNGCVVSLPSDCVVQNKKQPGEYFTTSTRRDIDLAYQVVDIGPMTRSCYRETILAAASVVWYGQMGHLLDGTVAVGQAYKEATDRGIPTYIMDEETKAAFLSSFPRGGVTHISGDGEVTSMLLHQRVPKALQSLTPYRKRIKKKPKMEDAVSSKPVSHTTPGMKMSRDVHRLSVDQTDVDGKNVVIRIDADVPIVRGVITDNYRLRMVVPTIKWVLKSGARLVILLGAVQPEAGHHNGLGVSLKPVALEMQRILNQPILFVPGAVGSGLERIVADAHPGSILFLENTAHHPEESVPFMTNDRYQRLTPEPTSEAVATFCLSLSKLADIYVMDAFGSLNSDTSSVTGIMSKQRACGFLVKNELKYLSKTFDNPPRRFLAILGGNRPQNIMPVMKSIMRDVDEMVLVGTLGLHFLHVEQGMELGKSLNKYVDLNDIIYLIDLAKANSVKLHYPVDLVLTSDLNNCQEVREVSTSEGVISGWSCADIGIKSCSLFNRVIKRARLILWKGVAGVAEIEAFSKGTRAILEAVQESGVDPERGLVSVLCGRGVSQFVHALDPNHTGISHVTTGGEVALRLLAKKPLVGMDSLVCTQKKHMESLNRLSVDQVELRDQRVLLRAELDTPIRAGEVEDSWSLSLLLNTIKFIQRKGAKCVVVIGHLGDPQGRHDESLTLLPVKAALERVLKQEIQFLENGVTDAAESASLEAEGGKVLMLENLRFHPEEEGFEVTSNGVKVNMPYSDIQAYRSKLSKLGDIYVNESLSSLCSVQSSVVGLTTSQRVTGLMLKSELAALSTLQEITEPPRLFLIGGGDVLEGLTRMYHALDRATDVILWGDCAFTYLKATTKMAIGKSPYNGAAAKLVPRIVKKANLNEINVHLPKDFLAAHSVKDEEPSLTQDTASGIPEGYVGLDIGPDTVEYFKGLIGQAKAIMMCGVPGAYEHENFSTGVTEIVGAIQAATEEGAVSVAFGPRTVTCLHKLSLTGAFSMCSTSILTCMHVIMGRPLPGLAMLSYPSEKTVKALTLLDAELEDKRVMVKLDLRVPTVDGVVLNTDRLEAGVPTIRYVLDHGATCVVIVGSRGNPKGFRNAYLSMEPLVDEFSHLLETQVVFLDSPCSAKTRSILKTPKTGSVFLMENLKFYSAESPVEEEDAHGTAADSDEEEEDEKSDAQSDAEDESSQYGLKRDGIDQLMWQSMPSKTREQFSREMAECADVFINDDVEHIHESSPSNEGFGIEQRACGLSLLQHLQASTSASLLSMPGVEGLSPALKP